MSITRFCFTAVSSELMKTRRCKYSIFLNEKYDSAIWGIDNYNGSIIYSLFRLICIDIEEMGLDCLSPELQDKHNLFFFLKNNFCDFFDELQMSTDGVPPSIHYDAEQEFKTAA